MPDTPLVLTTLPVDLAPGVAFDKYRVVERIGSGGMGVVYRAEHVALQRQVAIKVLNAESATDPEFVERFQREARVMASMESHPNVVQVFDFGRLPSGQPFLAMELLTGKTLDQVLSESKQLEVVLALTYVDQILAGLKEAHAAGVVHRDVKPANVFVGKTVKVLDFGLATGKPLLERGNTDRPANETRPMGTPCYVSPEQAQGLPVGPTSDLYSVGIVLYELLSGQVPFPLEDHAPTQEVQQVLRQHLQERPTPLFEFVQDVPRNVSDFVDKLLSKEPARRCVSAEVARAEIRQILNELRDFRTVPGMMAPGDTAPLALGAKHAVTQKIDRAAVVPVPVPVANTGDLAAAAGVGKRNTGRNAAIVALIVIVLLLLWALWPAGDTTPDAVVTNTPPPAAIEVAPETPKVVEAIPAPPVIDEEPLTPLKNNLPPAPTPKPAPLVVRTQPKSTFTITEKDCVVSKDWKRDRERDLNELAAKASSSKSISALEMEGYERSIGLAINGAQSNGDCVKVSQDIDSLKSRVMK